MKLFVVALALCLSHEAYGQGLFQSLVSAPGQIVGGAGKILGGLFGQGNTGPVDSCGGNAAEDYKKAINDFYNRLYTQTASRNNNHFVFSPYTIWMSLAALAEGADPSVQSQLFASLGLPQASCARNKFYDIAVNVERPGRDVSLLRRRSLVLDEGLKENPDWANMVRNTGLLHVSFAPIKRDPKETSQRLRSYLATRANIALTGNSVLLDSLDYQGLWTTAFADANIQRQPFFNDVGQQIGYVEMMRMKKRVRLAQVPFMNAKVLELPVGDQGRYTMLIGVGTGNGVIRNSINIFMGSILEIFSLLQMSIIPLEIAVPRFSLSTEFNARPALEDVGIRAFWRDPAATRYVSNPPAAPGGLIQRVSVKIDSAGVEPPPSSGSDILSGIVHLATDTATGVASAVGHQFVADRPFMFALFDTETHTCLFAGAFSKPPQ